VSIEQLEDQFTTDERAGLGTVPDGRRIKRGLLQGISVNVLLAVLGVAFLLPLIWLVDASLNPHASAALIGPAWSITNYRAAFAAGAGGAIKNSLYLAIVSTIVATTVSTLAAFALSRHRVPFKGSLLVLILFLTGLPVTLLLIPIFEMFVRFGWLNSPFYTSLVLAATSVPFAIWLLKNFIDQVPRELEEAAAIEGASELRILWRIVIPLAMPGILVASILTFINAWGAFLIPLVLDANPQDQTGALGIYTFMSANGVVHFGPLAAYSIVFSAPVVVLYLICSRWLNGGFAFAGGVKG
jgi:multiple sugar transport system permease protein